MTDYNNNTPYTIGSFESETRVGIKHTLRWTEWGDAGNPHVVICAHGLSRNGRDFDFLARALAHRYRVICPDYPGRGASDWLTNPVYYNNEQYVLDSRRLLDSLSFRKLDWIGTSMGGLIGMALAAETPELFRRMVINDIGAFIPGAALREIADYLGEHPSFESLGEAEEYYRTVYASFGPLEDHHYSHFVDHGVAYSERLNRFALNYDPTIIDQFVNAPLDDIELWETWQKISCPTLIIRGKHSHLLLAQTVEQMKHRHPKTESIEIPDCAHAPSLMTEDQIAVIDRWLD